ncbi:MAG: choice-of-anchor E domain-containing protein [Verrucomicrobiota bacterium]
MPAVADTESFTAAYGSASAPFSVGGDDFPVNLAFPQFDASLGDLTGIEVTLTTTGLLQADVSNVGAATTFSDAEASGTITVSGPDGEQSLLTLTTTPFSGSIAAGTPASPTYSLGPQTSLSLQSVSEVPSSDFSAYEASGSGGSLEFPLDAAFDGSSSGNGPSSLSFAGDASAFGSVEVDYTYMAAVPEPGQLLSWSLMCFGVYVALMPRSPKPGL